jgi:hypothetical protein
MLVTMEILGETTLLFKPKNIAILSIIKLMAQKKNSNFVIGHTHNIGLLQYALLLIFKLY